MYVCSENSDTSQMEKLILYAGDETVGLAMGVVRSLRSVESWGVALPSQSSQLRIGRATTRTTTEDTTLYILRVMDGVLYCTVL